MHEEKASRDDLRILILAAGASARMRGTDKLLQPVGGVPLLRHVAMQAVATGLPVHATLPAGDSERGAILRDLPITVIAVSDPDRGMGASLAAGVAALPAAAAGVMVIPADMPELTTADLLQAAEVFDGQSAIRATSAEGRRGHPVILPARLFAALAGLDGDRGAQGLLASETPLLVALPGCHATTDLDTPEDWLAWRRRNPGK